MRFLKRYQFSKNILPEIPNRISWQAIEVFKKNTWQSSCQKKLTKKKNLFSITGNFHKLNKIEYDFVLIKLKYFPFQAF